MAEYGIKSIYVTALTDVELTDKEGEGTYRFVGENAYVWTRMDAVGCAAGELLCRSATTEVTGKVPANTLSQAIGIGRKMGRFGVAASGGAVTASYYFWLQMNGVVNVRKMAVLVNRDGTRSWPIIGATLGRLNVVTTNQTALSGIKVLATVSTTASTLVSCRIMFFH